MRTLEWLIAVVVVAVVWYWVRGYRAPLALGAVGFMLVVLSIALEGHRAVMFPAYAVVLVVLVVALLGPGDLPPSAGALRWAGRGTGAFLVLLFGVALPALWPVFRLPTPTGPYSIGTTWLVVKDPTRLERFSDSPGAVREFPVKVWYPAPRGTTGRTARYAAPESPTILAPVFMNRQLDLVQTHAIVDAPMAAIRAPVLVFSHGYGGYAEQNTVQMEELASRGYVVFSIVHPGEAAWAPFPDGRGVGYATTLVEASRRRLKERFGSMRAVMQARERLLPAMAGPDRAERLASFRQYLLTFDEPLRSESVREWALDTRALVDQLEALEAGRAASPFKGRLDLARLGVFGMSYGGATAGEFCRLDARCRAAVNIDGAAFGGLIDDTLSVPLLILAADENGRAAQVPVLDVARGPTYLARVPATNHMGLSDLSLMGPVLFRWTGLAGRLAPDRREAIMNDFIVGFFEKHLAGSSPALFDSLAAKYPDVAITTRNVP